MELLENHRDTQFHYTDGSWKAELVDYAVTNIARESSNNTSYHCLSQYSQQNYKQSNSQYNTLLRILYNAVSYASISYQPYKCSPQAGNVIIRL